MKKFKRYGLVGAFILAAILAQGCILPATKAEWQNNSVPALKQTVTSAVDAVMSLVPGMVVAVVTDGLNLLPTLWEETGLSSSEEEGK